MKTRYTFHALERMKRRGISREEVEACITNPDKIIENEEFKCVKKLNNKLLIVVYRIEAGTITVITAYHTSKLHKYF